MPAEELKRILVIEDNPTDVELIKEALKEHGVRFGMTVIPNGRIALEHLKQITAATIPHLIILDVNMPYHDGIEVLAHYRATEALSKVPIIVLTSSDSPNDRQRTEEIGISAFICKPMDLWEFIALGKRFKSIMG